MAPPFSTPGPVPPERDEADSEDGRRWHYRTEGETAELASGLRHRQNHIGTW